MERLPSHGPARPTTRCSKWTTMETGDPRRENFSAHDTVSALSEPVSILFFGIANIELGEADGTDTI